MPEPTSSLDDGDLVDALLNRENLVIPSKRTSLVPSSSLDHEGTRDSKVAASIDVHEMGLLLPICTDWLDPDALVVDHSLHIALLFHFHAANHRLGDVIDPAMFTTAVAAQAVTEFLHRLTGFLGEERLSSEVLLFLHESQLRRNRQPPKEDCVCMEKRHWGRGDTKPFLGRTWPSPKG